MQILDIPEKPASLCSNEGDVVRVCPIIDLKLLAVRNATQNNDLFIGFRERFAMIATVYSLDTL